jgi:hypothetical protein
MASPSVQEVHTFWAPDVEKALRRLLVKHKANNDEEVATFMRLLQDEYNQRWERDPEGGEGAVEWLDNLITGEGDL